MCYGLEEHEPDAHVIVQKRLNLASVLRYKRVLLISVCVLVFVNVKFLQDNLILN